MTKFWSCHGETRRSAVQIRTTPPSPKILNVLVQLEDNNASKATINNTKEATQLIEAGFEYITKIDGTKLFKKRK